MPIILQPVDAPPSGVAPPKAEPRVSTLYGEALPERLAAVRVQDGQAPTVVVTVRDDQGRPLDLLDAVGLTGPDELTANLDLVEAVQRRAITTFAGVVVAGDQGKLEFPVDVTLVPGPGVYDAQARVAVGAAAPYVVFPLRVLIERSLFSPDWGGPPTVAEIRLHVRDSSPAESRLLDGLSWDDSEIAAAIVRPVDYFNEALPPLDVRYSTNTFPFRYNWLEAIKSCLYRMAAEFHRRNQLPYQAGGTSIDDHGTKAREYDEMAESLWQRYERWVLQTRVRMNIDQGFATEVSPYAFAARGYYPST